MNLNEAKSMLAQSIMCELNYIQLGNIDCANKMLQYRQASHIRIYMIECMLSDYPDQNKTLVEYLMEQLKELIQMISINNC